MLDALVRQLFTEGLKRGYLGKRLWGDPDFIKRQFYDWFMKTFRIFLKVPEVAEEYSEYTDSYFFKNRSGAGFEIAELGDGVGKRTFMRHYVGAGLDEAPLLKLGITHKTVTAFLKRMLLEAGDKTRLDQPFSRKSKDGKWEYVYSCGDETGFFSEIFGVPLFSATEIILFRADDGSRYNVLTHLFTFVEVK